MKYQIPFNNLPLIAEDYIFQRKK